VLWGHDGYVRVFDVGCVGCVWVYYIRCRKFSFLNVSVSTYSYPDMSEGVLCASFSRTFPSQEWVYNDSIVLFLCLEHFLFISSRTGAFPFLRM
jgi:hypothetical protein